MVVDFIVSKSLSDGVLLRIVRSDDIDRVLGKLHQFLLLRVLRVQSLAGSKLLETEVFELKYGVDLAHVVVTSSFELFLPRRNVNEQERSV